MGKLAEILESVAERISEKRPTIYKIPSEEEVVAHRVRAEMKEAKTYRLSEEERLALIEKYGPPMEPEKVAAVRKKWQGIVGVGFISKWKRK